jgi:hypothetical protein
MSDDRETIRRELEARPTEELLSILRNRDEDEWRPEVFDIVAAILAARGLSPTEVVAQGPEGEDVLEGQQLVTVNSYFSAADAHVRRMALEEAGLQAWVCDETFGGWYGIGIGSRLQVRVEDETAARAVLEVEVGPAIPPELAEPMCPKCGSSEVNQTAEVPDPLLPRPTEWSRRYECGSCRHAWSDETQDERQS